MIPSSFSPPRSSRWGSTSFIFIPVTFRHKDKHLNVTAWVRERLVGVAHRREGYPGPLASIPKHILPPPCLFTNPYLFILLSRLKATNEKELGLGLGLSGLSSRCPLPLTVYELRQFTCLSGPLNEMVGLAHLSEFFQFNSYLRNQQMN